MTFHIFVLFYVYCSIKLDANHTENNLKDYDIQHIMSSTGTDKASISDVEEALHDKEEKRRKAREAYMRYYYKNKERISQQFKDKLKNDEEFKNKV